MWTADEISTNIRSALLTYDPDISLDPGTPERKIVDAVASVLASVQVDKFVQMYANDLSSKFGTDLDSFVETFGLARQAARPARGYVTFSTGSINSTSAIIIPAGTLVSSPSTNSSIEVDFYTLADTTIPVNSNTAQAIIEAIIPGRIGNVPANSITSIISATNNIVANITAVTNQAPTSGGSDSESDAELKLRFQNTIFRNISGTIDQFIGLVVANPNVSNVTRAQAIGPVSLHSEYVQIPSTAIIGATAGIIAATANVSSQYLYSSGYFLSSDGTDAATFYKPGVDFTWGTTTTSDGDPAPLITVSNVIDPAPSGTVINVAAYGTGVLSGIYQYAYTNVYNPGGESSLGTPSLSTALINQQAYVTGILTDAGTSLTGGTVTARNIYRSADGGATWGFVQAINDNTGTAIYDNSVAATNSPPTNSLAPNSVIYLQYQYLSEWSRNYINDSSGVNITNKVDIYADGISSQAASDIVTGPGSVFSNGTASKFYYQNYTRGHSTAFPSTANNFIQLTWTPVTSLPSQLVINGITYNMGSALAATADYWLVKDITKLRESVNARDGVEISAAMGTAISSSTFPVAYYFNDIPLVTQNLIDQHKQVNQDVLVHLPNYRYFRVGLVIIYKNGFSTTTVNNMIATTVSNWFESQTFGFAGNPTEILEQVFTVQGVDSARFSLSTDGDAVNYGLQEVDEEGNLISSLSSSTPIYLEDIDLPLLYDLGLNGPIQRTLNTWV